MRIFSHIALAAVFLTAGGAALQGGQARAHIAPAERPPAATPKAAKKQAKQVPADQLDRLLKMSPEERERELSRLPANQRKQVQNRLDTLDRLSPAQRQQRIDRLREMEQLPPERQQAVTGQIRSMNQMSIADQREYLHSPGFGQSFSGDEQQIIRERFPAASSDVVRPTDKLLPGRRQIVADEVRRIQAMLPRQRRQTLHDPAFTQNFSPDEQEIIRKRFPNAAR